MSIVQYLVLQGNPNDVAAQATDMLSKGYDLYGNPYVLFASTSIIYYQAMIKREIAVGAIGSVQNIPITQTVSTFPNVK